MGKAEPAAALADGMARATSIVQTTFGLEMRMRPLARQPHDRNVILNS